MRASIASPTQRPVGILPASGSRGPVPHTRLQFVERHEEGSMAEAEGRRLGKHSAAELLGDWRAAERDVAAAQAHADTASLAEAAAQVAQVAALETSDAARLSLVAAERASEAAKRTAEAALVTASAASSDKADASTALEAAKRAETQAGDAFRDAQRLGFPQDEGGVEP
jgi:hypothetical protein